MASDKTVAPTWDDVVTADVGQVFVDRFEDGLRFIILRGPFHLCAYVGVPESHPLAGHSYEHVPAQAHGGLTYSSAGDDSYLPSGWWWYGWDYGHCDDYMISDHSTSYAAYNEKRTKWGVAEVDGDSWSTIYDFKALLKLAEAIHTKAIGWRKSCPK